LAPTVVFHSSDASFSSFPQAVRQAKSAKNAVFGKKGMEMILLRESLSKRAVAMPARRPVPMDPSGLRTVVRVNGSTEAQFMRLAM
jgi:hypothetical protein